VGTALDYPQRCGKLSSVGEGDPRCGKGLEALLNRFEAYAPVQVHQGFLLLTHILPSKAPYMEVVYVPPVTPLPNPSICVWLTFSVSLNFLLINK
jgi:hypothetical protein